MKNNIDIRRILRFLFVIIVLIFGLIAQSLSVFAHDPSNMDLIYDFGNQQLNVTITHNTPAPNQHYIQKVEIWVNDVLKLTQDYTNQPTTSTFTYTYDLPSLDSDEIEVKATCSISGDIIEKIRVVDPNIEEPNGSSKKEMDLQLFPSITTLDENTDQSFTLDITSNSQPLGDLDIDIDLKHGFISELDEITIGRYEFIYFGIEVSGDESETIKITAKKDDYKDGSLEVKFTIKNKQPSSNAKNTLDGIISVDEYEFKVKLDGDNFILHWISDGDLIQFAMEARTAGWVAIGFEPTVKMKDADMIFGWVEDNGDAFVLDTYSTGEFGPHPPDGSDDILEYGGTQANGKTIIEFQRYFDTGDLEDKEIKKSGEVKLIWAIGGNDDYTSGHTSRGYGTIDISTGEYTAGTELWLFHASFMVLGFIFLIMGICIAKTMRKKRWWLKTHRALGVLGAIFGIIGIIIAIIMVESAGTGHIRYPHSLIGIITIIFLLITPTLGYKISKGKTSKGLKATHCWIGRIALILMIFNIVSGLVLKGII
jgi:hypothetical protein